MDIEEIQKTIYESKPVLEYYSVITSSRDPRISSAAIESHSAIEMYFVNTVPEPLVFDFINSTMRLSIYEAIFIPANCPHHFAIREELFKAKVELIHLRICLPELDLGEPFIIKDQHGLLEKLFTLTFRERVRSISSNYLNEYYVKALLTVACIMREQDRAPAFSVTSVVQYIRNHYSEKITLDTLAENEHVSKSYLCRQFKQQHECTISYYINQVRIEQAHHLLIETNMNIEEIAYAVGFDSAKYFSQVFKKYSGQSASQFRSQGK